MTPRLATGTYRLKYYATNPEFIPYSDDWRHQAGWKEGTKVYCFDCYSSGSMLPSLYIGNQPGRMVNTERFPIVFAALVPYLEKA